MVYGRRTLNSVILSLPKDQFSHKDGCLLFSLFGVLITRCINTKMKMPFHQRPYVASKNYQDLLTMVINAMGAIYEIQGPFELKRAMREKIFHDLVWMVTEHDGKFTTRYRSKIAVEMLNNDVQHEHVFPIDDLYFLSRHGLSLKEVFSLCMACVVTVEEHKRLTLRDRQSDRPMGWRRYLKAGIEVMDMLENRIVTSAEMEAWTVPFENAMWQSRNCGDGEVDLELERLDKAKIEKPV